MNPTIIDILGEDYFLISHTGAEEYRDTQIKDAVSVNLLPSLTADFCVRSYSKNGVLRRFDPIAAVSAAAYLSLKQGLPLDELVFETPSGLLTVFCTGDGVFTLTLQKCKVLFTETPEILGCAVSYTDVNVGRVCRVVRAENITSADPSALAPLLSVGRYLPDALLFSSINGGELKILPYADFNPSPPSRAELFAATALAYQERRGEFTADGGFLIVRAGCSAVDLKIKCEIK